jgi:hypothetical protein
MEIIVKSRINCFKLLFVGQPTTSIECITNNKQQVINCSITNAIKPKSQHYMSTLDKPINDRMMSEGRKHKYKDILSKTTTKEPKFNILRKY